MEEIGQILKSIGFPIRVLSCTDKAAADIYKSSRSALVVRAMRNLSKTTIQKKKQE